MNTNYHKQMEKTINSFKGEKPKLLLHSCCAPCSSYCIEFLCGYFDIDIMYYNPNIYSEEEFRKRLEEQKRYVKEQNLDIKVIDTGYDEQEFLDYIKGDENAPEGSTRCKKCYELRLNKTAEYANNKGYDFFTTTLSISPLKNAQWINEIGLQIQKNYDIKFLQSDFKKRGGYIRSIELSKIHNLYRQNFCGCRFSLK